MTRFMKAYVEGIHRFKTDKAAALAILEKYITQKTTPAAEKIYEIYATKYFKRAPEATPAAIQTILVNRTDVPATGAGETAITGVGAAVGNAIFDATGVRLRQAPFTPERIKAALAARRT